MKNLSTTQEMFIRWANISHDMAKLVCSVAPNMNSGKNAINCVSTRAGYLFNFCNLPPLIT